MRYTRVHAALLMLALGWQTNARAQACSEELRSLQTFRQRMRTEVMAGNVTRAVELSATQEPATPPGYDYENSKVCRDWALEVALVHRASCSFDSARAQLESIQTDQPLAIDALRTAREQLARAAASAPFSCKDKEDLYLLCQPISESAPDAWCARRVEHDATLQIPRGAWCKLVDRDGNELSNVNEGAEPTCREELVQQARSQRVHIRAQRRERVATAGTGVALMAAAAIPLTFVPQGISRGLYRVGAIDKGDYERLRHRSMIARRRVLPLLGVTALSVSALSSRFWWAGLLTAGCGVAGDVLLAQHWHHPDKTRRNVGITAATVGAVAGLLLNLETLSYSDASSRYALLPTFSVGVAQAELGLTGRF